MDEPLFTVVDFETASACELKRAGADRYAADPTTEILCLVYTCPRSGARLVWTPGSQDWDLLRDYAENPRVVFVAHNAGFEQAIWRHIMVPQFGFPPLPAERWHDTMAVAAMKALPMEMGQLAALLQVPVQKDLEGRRLTLSLSRPDRKGRYPNRAALLPKVLSYCADDVGAEAGIHKRLGWLPPAERRVWLLDQQINQRGLAIDLDLVAKCKRIVDDGSRPLLAEFKALTGVNVTQGAKTLEWCLAQGSPLPNLAKETLAKVLGATEEIEEEDFDDGEDDDLAAARDALPGQVRRALTIRQLVGSASIKKLARMESCVGFDGRARGLLQYHGTGPGRWAGRLLQPQNFPRPTLKLDKDPMPPEMIVAALQTGDAEYVAATVGAPVETVVSGLRHCLIAGPGCTYCVGDYAGIQARLVLALAGQHDKTALMAGGADVYCDMASAIYHHPIDKKKDPKERQTGKNSVLGLGFQMGWRKFKLKYAQEMPDEEVERIVQTYRKEWAPLVPKVWYGLEGAAVRTVWDGTPHEAYGVEYRLEDGWLSARLHSGRKIWYWNPQKVRKAMPWDETNIRLGFTYQAKKNGQIKTIQFFGGLAAENVVMGMERDIMVSAAYKLEDNNFPLVLTNHDEWVAEPLLAHADLNAFNQILCDTDPWVKAMQAPIATECWAGDRYRK